jgi:hypothetical protein
MAGAPWIAKEWFSQVLFACAYALAGWNGVVVLAAAAVALAFALLTRFLLDELEPLPALTLATAALVLCAPHLVARPHVLAWPLMVVWVGGLVRAADREGHPPWWLLPVMAVWANMHGGFTLGLALLVPVVNEAVWRTQRDARRTANIGWLGFAALAAIAACATPYGPESILMTPRILGLGDALAIINEWKPSDFSRIAAFEVCLLLAIGFAVHRGLRLPPMRIVVLLGLLHLALAHVRNVEILGLLGPLFLARPLAQHFGASTAPAERWLPTFHTQSGMLALASGLALLAAATWTATTALSFAPNPGTTPKAAVEAVKAAEAGPLLNDYGFGGYLIYAGMRPFIDGRTELYGGPFTARHHRAVSLQDLADFLRLLDEYRIGATLLAPTTPAVALLDRLPAWERIYADDIAVVHRRRKSPEAAPIRPTLP